MSRIYFHNEHDTAEVWGRERAYMGVLCNDLLIAALGVTGELWDERFLNIVPPGSWLHTITGRKFAESFRLWLRASDDEYIIDGRRIPKFDVAINTALVMGSDAIKLMARLHGQCEIHAYVEEQHRMWLAGIIHRGVQANILTKSAGWLDVITLLRSPHPGPVVTSYSVTESFPNAGIANDTGVWHPPDDKAGRNNWDAWYELSTKTQWELGMQALRQMPERELTPDTWNEFYFYDGTTGFDIRRKVYESYES